MQVSSLNGVLHDSLGGVQWTGNLEDEGVVQVLLNCGERYEHDRYSGCTVLNLTSGMLLPSKYCTVLYVEYCTP